MNIELPDNFVASTSQNASDLITALSPVITLILGVLLTAVVITIIINAIKK